MTRFTLRQIINAEATPGELYTIQVSDSGKFYSSFQTWAQSEDVFSKDKELKECSISFFFGTTTKVFTFQF